MSGDDGLSAKELRRPLDSVLSNFRIAQRVVRGIIFAVKNFEYVLGLDDAADELRINFVVRRIWNRQEIFFQENHSLAVLNAVAFLCLLGVVPRFQIAGEVACHSADTLKRRVARSPLDINKAVVFKCHEDIGDIGHAVFDVMNVLGEFVAAGIEAASRDFNVVDNHLITSFIRLSQNIGDKIEEKAGSVAE